MGPTSFGAAGVATLRQWRREQVYGNEAPPPPRPLCRARPPAREARERGAGLGAAAIAAAAAGTRGTSGRRGGRRKLPGPGRGPGAQLRESRWAIPRGRGALRGSRSGRAKGARAPRAPRAQVARAGCASGSAAPARGGLGDPARARLRDRWEPGRVGAGSAGLR